MARSANIIKTCKRLLGKWFGAIYLAFATSNQKADYYRKHFGIKIGRNVRFTGKPRWATEPYLIEIGDDVTITQDVVFHTHDGGVAVFRKQHPNLNVFGRIVIGNNVFIGSNSIFLPGVTVGNNVVIGAGSIVTKDIPNNVVAAGVPARVIKTLEEYYASIEGKAVTIDSCDPEQRKNRIIAHLEKR